MSFRKAFIFAVVVVLVASTVDAARSSIRDIEINNGRPITLSKQDGVWQVKDFDIDIELSGDTCGTSLILYVDADEWEALHPGCMEGDDDKRITKKWVAESEDSLSCGPHTLRAELYHGDRLDDETSVDFAVGNFPDITFEPEQPRDDEPVTIRFLSDGSPAPNVKFKIIYKHIKEVASGSTSSAGAYTFRPDDRGSYRLKIEDSRYCGEKTFYAKAPIMVAGPFPANPVVGELITIGVPPGVGVKVADPQGDICITCENREGGANFTIDEPGNYTIVIGELSTRYWGVNVSLPVSDRPPLELVITPERAVAKKQIVLDITSRGVPLPGAKVVVTKPDSSVKSFVSSEAGKVYYTEAAESGTYEVTVEKQRYKSLSDSFEVKNDFTVRVEPDKPLIGQQITFTVTDQLGRSVPNAVVSVADTNISLKTTPDGRASLKLADQRDYDISIVKEGYWGKSVMLSPFGLLALEMSAADIEVGSPIYIDVPGTADIEITTPNGSVDSYLGTESLEYTPESVGVYRVQASKPDHVSAKKEFTVLPHLLSADYSVVEDDAFVTVTSNGDPVADLAVSVATPRGQTLTRTTDGAGAFTHTIDVDGVYVYSLNADGSKPTFAQSSVGGRVYKDRDYVLITTVLVVLALVATVLIAVVVAVHRQMHGQAPPEKRAPSRPTSAFSQQPSPKRRRTRLG